MSINIQFQCSNIHTYICTLLPPLLKVNMTKFVFSCFGENLIFIFLIRYCIYNYVYIKRSYPGNAYYKDSAN